VKETEHNKEQVKGSVPMISTIITKQHSDVMHEMGKLLFGSKIKIEGSAQRQSKRMRKIFAYT
jgi:hypothetical protein